MWPSVGGAETGRGRSADPNKWQERALQEGTVGGLMGLSHSDRNANSHVRLSRVEVRDKFKQSFQSWMRTLKAARTLKQRPRTH